MTDTLGGSTHPFVLLQPHPKLQDIIPNLPATVKENPLNAYVGLVAESGRSVAQGQMSELVRMKVGDQVDSDEPSLLPHIL